MRLVRQADFKRVLAGSRLHAGQSLVAFSSMADHGALRVGVASSRQLKRAVDRNRARRRLREAVRLVMLDSAPGDRGIGYDVVLIARPAALSVSWELMKGEVSSVARRLRRP